MESPMQQQNVSDARKRKGRLAVYAWRKAHPDAYKALCRKSLHTYYTKHCDIILSVARKNAKQLDVWLLNKQMAD